MPNNDEFLQALFSEDAPFVHVTDFNYDPNDIPSDKHLIAWKGDWYSRYPMGVGTNQYFTISIFNPDDEGTARRRKALFLRTRVIVLDDVKEKLSMSEVTKLPSPSWILETSPGSEQWGYILDTPCADRARVENLLDGLVANGLAPNGRDPGMKGVTRYVRLPDGVNNKASKLVDGLPFQCRVTLWQPFHTTTMEALAAPFAVNLDAPRRESRTDGAADIPDHPLLQIPELVHVHDVRSDGRFDVRCPWVDEHTGAVDNGAAVFTNEDGSIGFKCHHGACEGRSAKDLLTLIESHKPGFRQQFAAWQGVRAFADVAEVSFLGPAMPVAPPPPPRQEAASPEKEAAPSSLEDLLGELNRERPGSPRSNELAKIILKSVDQLGAIEKKQWHDQVCDLMMWSKADFKTIIKDLQREWYGERSKDSAMFDDIVYIKELNQFYDFRSRIFYTAEAFQNSFAHEDEEARKTALVEGRVSKVDKLNYAPRRPRIYQGDDGLVYGNSWDETSLRHGAQADASRWLEHFNVLGWGEEREHILKWMAYTVKFPEKKINHALLLGSGEGCGKDFLLYPLFKAMGSNATIIDGTELLDDFNDYLLSTKYLHINETELGTHKEAVNISNKLKPLAAAPPETLSVNQKGIRRIKIDNIVNTTMTTNSQLPLKLQSTSRRFYAVWSDLNPRDEYDNMLPEWLGYWDDRWSWMKGGGFDACIWYLHNCVDLSTFDAGAAPPMTQFLRDIREASKSPIHQTVEALIFNRVGSLAADVVTSRDIVDMCHGAEIYAPGLISCDMRYFSESRINVVMAGVAGVARLGTHPYTGSMMWAIRNKSDYMGLGNKELTSLYQKQADAARIETGLRAVK